MTLDDLKAFAEELVVAEYEAIVQKLTERDECAYERGQHAFGRYEYGVDLVGGRMMDPGDDYFETMETQLSRYKPRKILVLTLHKWKRERIGVMWVTNTSHKEDDPRFFHQLRVKNIEGQPCVFSQYGRCLNCFGTGVFSDGKPCRECRGARWRFHSGERFRLPAPDEIEVLHTPVDPKSLLLLEHIQSTVKRKR